MSKEYARKHRDEVRSYQKAYFAANKERLLAGQRNRNSAYTKKRRDRVASDREFASREAAIDRDWRIRNPEKVHEYRRRASNSFAYAARLLKRSFGADLEAPDALVQAKLELIFLLRKIKEARKNEQA